MVSIIIPCWNKLDLTKMCIEGIESFTPEEYEIIFIDNGSEDGTPQYLKHNMKPNWKLIDNGRNFGFPMACNQGMSMAEGDVLLILNNDTIVSPEWLKGMLECLNHAPDVGIVGPRSNAVSGAQLFTDGKYSNVDEYIEFTKNFRKTFRGLYIPRWRIVGFCFMFRRELMDKIGQFDERFSPGNFEDDDYCTRAFGAGYRNFVCSDVFVHHHCHQSHDPLTFQALLNTNMEKWIEKYRATTPKTVSACMIVKNEEDMIGRCLKSLSEYVDEIILVDTGSTDKTKEVAHDYPKVKIFDFKWDEDFSEARNYASSKATCDWIFSVDADEIVTGFDKDRLLWHPYTATRILTRNYTANMRVVGWHANPGEFPGLEVGCGWFGSEKIRLWPNDKRIQFAYPVHEVVEESCFMLGYRLVTDSGVIVHHYGRMKDNYEYGHGDRYYQLLHKQWKSGKNDLRSIEQLATQAQGLFKWQEAIEFWKEMLAIDPTHDAPLLNIGHCYASSGDWKTALEWARKAAEAAPDKREAAMNYAVCLMRNGDLDTAETIAHDLVAKHPDYPLPKSFLEYIHELRTNEIFIGGI